MTRQQLFEIIEKGNNKEAHTLASRCYDAVMIGAIILGILPLTFTVADESLSIYHQYPAFLVMDLVAVTFFIADYILRWLTADLRANKKGIKPFLLYPITFFGIIDLLSILPSFNLIGKGFVAFRIARLVRIFRLVRIVQYSENIELLLNVLQKERRILLSVLCLALFYIFTTGLIMFNADPVFKGKVFFEALYWATTALTTVGYGDIYPTTTLGQFVSMLSSLFGIAIIALPSGIITASFLEEIKEQKERKKN